MTKRVYSPLFRRHSENPILTAWHWPYPANSVFNPGATQVDGEVLLLVRVEDCRGFSHLTVARSLDGVTDWKVDPRPSLEGSPHSHPEEMWGIEDPRITRLDELNQWAICYTAYSEAGPLVSVALTDDFKSFHRLGPVMPPENKDAALFPRRFGGRWAMLHRPVSSFPGAGAHIWIAFSPDLRHWGDHRLLLKTRRGAWWDADRIGLSTPPLLTPDGWLILYHGARRTASGSIYRLGLALLDAENPTVVLKRSQEWVFGPEESYEKEGDVDDVVFPCGWVLDGKGDLKVYYGGADRCVALAIARMDDVLAYLRECRSLVDREDQMD